MRVNLPHCHKETTRHGAVVYYFRKGHRPRVRLPDKPGTARFMDAYTAALNGSQQVYIPKNVAPTQTLAWLVEEYRKSVAWAELSVATRRARDNICKRVLKDSGDVPFGEISDLHIRDALDARRDTPAAAGHFLKTMRGLFGWAKERRHVAVDPTLGIKLRVAQTEGHLPWKAEQMAAYEACWPVGTQQRLAYDILAYTGLRRGDAYRLGPQHVRDGVACIKTEKSGLKLEVHIPICPELAASIAATPHCESTFITSKQGRPFKKASFGNNFHDWCVAAGLDGYSAHGLRKTSSEHGAESGATEYELMARQGWKSTRTAGIYTAKVNRRSLALSASEKMQKNRKLPHPPAP